MKPTIVLILLVSGFAIFSCKKDSVGKSNVPSIDTSNNTQKWTIDARTDSINSKYIYSICRDHKGNMWFGTESGLSRYDGNKWTNYFFHDGFGAENIISDKSDNIWFSVRQQIDDCLECVLSKIMKFDGTTVTAYRDSIFIINTIFIDSIGNKWFGTDRGGLSVYDANNKKIAQYKISWKDIVYYNLVTSIAMDSNGDKWIGTSSGGVLKFDGTNWNIIKEATNVGFYITSIVIDSKQNKWFITNNGVLEFDGSNWNVIKDTDGLLNSQVNCMTMDSKGNLWFGTSLGVSRFDGSNWSTYNTANGLTSNYVIAIAADSKDNIWVGTFGGGVSKLSAL